MYKDMFEKITVNDELKQKIEERIDAKMKNKKSAGLKAAVLAACLVMVLSVGAFAAYRYLSASQAAKELGDNKLALSFENGQEMNVAAEDEPYRATLLGVCSGENLSDFSNSADEISPERTYAVLAVERTDGKEMTYDDRIMASPLIQGLDPMAFNVFTLNGGAAYDIIDGVLYHIIECDSIECLADRQLYMAVYQGIAPNSAYSMDAATGEITPKADYDGANMLIKLELDPAKADSAKARALIERINKEMGRGENADGADE